MKKTFRIITVSFILSACSDNNIDLVKNGKFNFGDDFSIGDLLDNRSVCSNIEWIENKESNSILYSCTLKKGNKFFSFDESYANKLRNETYEKKLELYKNKTENQINKLQENLVLLDAENKKIKNLKSINENFFQKVNDERFKPYIFDFFSLQKEVTINKNAEKPLVDYFAKNFNQNQLQQGFPSYGSLDEKKNIIFFIDVYDYFKTGNNNFDIGNFINQIKSKKENCIANKTEEAANDLLKNPEWLDSVKKMINTKVIEQCEKSYTNKDMWDYDLVQRTCIARSMESNNNYFSYAEQSVSSGEYQQKFDSQCSNLLDRQLDEAKQLLSNYSESLNHDLNKYFDYLIYNNIETIESIKNKIPYLKSSDFKDKNIEKARDDAEIKVREYSLTHILYGKEMILWEYNNVKKEYILKRRWMVQYEYGGKETSFNLNMDKLIYSSLTNIDNIDEYMTIRNQDAINKLNRLIYNR